MRQTVPFFAYATTKGRPAKCCIVGSFFALIICPLSVHKKSQSCVARNGNPLTKIMNRFNELYKNYKTDRVLNDIAFKTSVSTIDLIDSLIQRTVDK